MRPKPPYLDYRDQPLIGLSVMWPCLGLLERVGADWDWWWVDGQHGDMDLREAMEIVRLSDAVQVPALVRIPSHDPSWVLKVLDAGAAGVIVPLIETVAQAEAMVQAAKFPPVGNRSYGGRRAVDRMGRQYYRDANARSKLILQVESDAAADLAGPLAAVPGVDGLFLGPDDMVIRRGEDVDIPKNRETVGRQTALVAEACRRNGKLSVGVAVSDPMMALARENGVSLVVCGGDVMFASQGSKAASDKARAAFAGVKAPMGAATPPAASGTVY